MAVSLDKGVERAMRTHAEESYPAESCGVLIGRFEQGDVVVLRSRRTPNAAGRDRTHRFVIHPRDIVSAEDEALSEGLDVVGFYHSHPDVPGSPSEEDKLHAWPGYLYAIVSVLQAQAQHVSFWRLPRPKARLSEETLVVR